MKIKDRYRYSFFGIILFCVLASINYIIIQADIHLANYFIPILVGGVSGFIIGFIKDKLELSVIEKQKLLDEKILFNQKLHEQLSEKKEVQDTLIQSRIEFSAFFSSISDVVMFTDTNRRILIINPAVKSMFGYEPDELTGKQTKVLYANDQDYYNQGRLRYNKHNNSTNEPYEIEYKRKNGEIFISETTGSPVKNGEGNVIGFIGIIRDISEKKELYNQLNFLAYHDPLTTLPNRLSFREELQKSILEAKDNNGNLAIMFLDLDRFKSINDTLGHDIGDQLLVIASKRIKNALSKNEVIYRMGGDEFTIIAKNYSNKKLLKEFIQRVLEIFNTPIKVSDYELDISTSIGVSCFPDDSKTIDELTKSADIAMYEAKAEGGNKFCFYSEEFKDMTIYRFNLESQLRNALKNKEFFLLYQPQIDILENKIKGIEALLYWESQNIIVSPGDFIPLAEESGFIIPLTEWVLKEACWFTQSINQDNNNLSIAVNLSTRHILETNFIHSIETLLSEVKLEPEKLELEITESYLLNVDKSIYSLEGLKKLGVKIAIDDFGTGYSSLGYLKDIPFDKLKIDKTFIDNVTHNENNASITKTIIALGHNLNKEVLAEGVENLEQLEYLKQNQCRLVQGYYFAKPLYPDDLKSYLDNF